MLQPCKLDDHLAKLAAERTARGSSSDDATSKEREATALRPTALELTTLFLEKAVEKVRWLRRPFRSFAGAQEVTRGASSGEDARTTRSVCDA